MATSVDGTRIACRRYGGGERVILFVPTWNLVDSRVVGHQVSALEPHADVLTYDPRGAGASERPNRGYDFPLHAADALAVLDTNGVERTALVTASRGLNAAVLLATNDPERFDRIAVIAPYMNLDPDPAPPDPEGLEALRNDWRGFVVPFMHAVFTEPDSADVIAEMIAIGLEATHTGRHRDPGGRTGLETAGPPPGKGHLPDSRRARRGRCTRPGCSVALAESIAASIPNARLELIPGGGHRPDIRTPELVNPLLLDFLLAP
jgi:pimeloyl-ACP methyl ester carboxylesterase